jgi:hypothetical protein
MFHLLHEILGELIETVDKRLPEIGLFRNQKDRTPDSFQEYLVSIESEIVRQIHCLSISLRHNCGRSHQEGSVLQAIDWIILEEATSEGNASRVLRTGKTITVGFGLVVRNANGVGSRFRATASHMEDASSENDFRPLSQTLIRSQNANSNCQM